MEYKDYLDNTKLKIEAKKGFDDQLIIRFGIRNGGLIYATDLNYETALKVINELNEIIENEKKI